MMPIAVGGDGPFFPAHVPQGGDPTPPAPEAPRTHSSQTATVATVSPKTIILCFDGTGNKFGTVCVNSLLCTARR